MASQEILPPLKNVSPGHSVPARLVVGVGVLVVLAGATSLIAAAVSAAVGLATIGAIALGGVALVQALPLLGQKLENKLLTARKREAAANPIEQLQNEWLRRNEMVASFKEAMTSITAQVQTMKDRLTHKRAADTKNGVTTDLSQEEAAIKKMEVFVQNRTQRLAAANQALVDFKRAIDDASFKWEFQLQANEAFAAMNATDRNAQMGEILSDTAFTSVQSRFNEVFARLELDAVEITGTKKLAFDTNHSIDVSGIDMGLLVPAQKRGGTQ
jgi:hypothetical protein